MSRAKNRRIDMSRYPTPDRIRSDPGWGGIFPSDLARARPPVTQSSTGAHRDDDVANELRALIDEAKDVLKQLRIEVRQGRRILKMADTFLNAKGQERNDFEGEKDATE